MDGKISLRIPYLEFVSCVDAIVFCADRGGQVSSGLRTQLALFVLDGGLAGVLSQRALHIYRCDSFKKRVFFALLGGPDVNPALRIHRTGSWVSIALHHAIDRYEDVRPMVELVLHCAGRGVEWIWDLSWTLLEIQQLGYFGATGEALPGDRGHHH